MTGQSPRLVNPGIRGAGLRRGRRLLLVPGRAGHRLAHHCSRSADRAVVPQLSGRHLRRRVPARRAQRGRAGHPLPGRRLPCPAYVCVWRLAHHGRNGTDVIPRSSPARPAVPTPRRPTSPTGPAGGPTDRDYLVPEGPTTTRFGFWAVSSAGGNPSARELHRRDLLRHCPVPRHRQAGDELGADQALDGQTVRTDDLITYRVAVRNDGGLPADVAELTDEIPAGLSYEPGTLTITDSRTTARTDAADGDGARISPTGGRPLPARHSPRRSRGRVSARSSDRLHLHRTRQHRRTGRDHQRRRRCVQRPARQVGATGREQPGHRRSRRRAIRPTVPVRPRPWRRTTPL